MSISDDKFGDGDYELIDVHKEVAMATPQIRYYDVDGISAASCLIPQTELIAKVVHFVSGSDGEEYGQFASRPMALTVAHSVTRRKRMQEGSS